jgi:hypothetical protein
MPEQEERRYSTKVFTTPKALETELDSMWDDTEFRREAERGGFEDVLSLGRKSAFAVRQDGQGLEPGTIALIVAFAPVAVKITEGAVNVGSKMVTDLWDQIVLPRLERRRGLNALKAADRKPKKK